MTAPANLLDELQKVATEHDVAVTYESLVNATSAGGLCRVRGKYRIIIDKRTSKEERALALARALARLDLQDDAMSDDCRKLITRYTITRP